MAIRNPVAAAIGVLAAGAVVITLADRVSERLNRASPSCAHAFRQVNGADEAKNWQVVQNDNVRADGNAVDPTTLCHAVQISGGKRTELVWDLYHPVRKTPQALSVAVLETSP